MNKNLVLPLVSTNTPMPPVKTPKVDADLNSIKKRIEDAKNFVSSIYYDEAEQEHKAFVLSVISYIEGYTNEPPRSKKPEDSGTQTSPSDHSTEEDDG